MICMLCVTSDQTATGNCKTNVSVRVSSCRTEILYTIQNTYRILQNTQIAWLCVEKVMFGTMDLQTREINNTFNENECPIREKTIPSLLSSQCTSFY